MAKRNGRSGKKGRGRQVRLSRIVCEKAKRRANGEETKEDRGGKKFTPNRKLFRIIKKAVQRSWSPISVVCMPPSRLFPAGLQQIVVADGEKIVADFLDVHADDLFEQRLRWEPPRQFPNFPGRN